MHSPRYGQALTTALCFLACSAAWILISDGLASRLPLSLEGHAAVQTYKGLAYVATMAPLLFWFLRRSERALVKAEAARLQEAALAEQSVKTAHLAGKVGAWRLDLARNEVFWSGALLELTGLDPCSFKNQFDVLGRYVPQEDFARLDQQRERASCLGEPIQMVCRFTSPDGRFQVFSLSSHVETDEAGAPRQLIGTALDITEQWHTEQRLVLRQAQLAATQQRFRVAFEAAPWGIVVTTFDGKTTWANKAALHLLGRKREEVEKGYLREFIAREDWRETEDQVGSLLAGQRDGTLVEKRFLRPDGTVVWTTANVSLLRDENGGPFRFIFMIKDVTAERQHALEQAQQLVDRRLATAVFEHSGEALAITDAHWRFVDVNAAFERVTGYAKKDLLQMTSDALLADTPSNGAVALMMSRALQAGRVWTGEVLCKRRNGELFRKLETVTSVVGSDHRVTNYVIVASDLTEQRQLDERLSQLSRIDSLTGLPNRIALEEHLRAMTALARPSLDCLGLILLSYDRFPAINELVGSPAGDKVLREGAARLADGVDGKCFVARYGGCRFAVVAPLGITREELIDLAKRCISLMQTTEPLSNGVEVPLTVSAGLSTVTPVQGDKGSLINQAESALLLQGSRERGTLRFFSPEVAAGVSRHLAVETGLLQADFEKEFRVLLQPKWDIATKQVIGAEALLRWDSPELGEVAPNEFIPIAEQHGNILEIGRWVLQKVVQLLAERRQEHLSLKISVNVSARQLEDPDFLPFVLRTVAKAGLPPSCLELEITETFLVRNQQAAESILADLRQHGFSLALDDFGVGYSSLSYLAKFPVDVVKLDRSFIEQLPMNETTCVVAASVLELAKRLSMTTVAEGVETEAQRAFLQQAGCVQAQGWLVAPALSVEEFFMRLTAGKKPLSLVLTSAPETLARVR